MVRDKYEVKQGWSLLGTRLYHRWMQRLRKEFPYQLLPSFDSSLYFTSRNKLIYWNSRLTVHANVFRSANLWVYKLPQTFEVDRKCEGRNVSLAYPRQYLPKLIIIKTANLKGFVRTWILNVIQEFFLLIDILSLCFFSISSHLFDEYDDDIKKLSK